MKSASLVTVSVVALRSKAIVMSVLDLRSFDDEVTEVTARGALAPQTPVATSSLTAYS